VAALFPPGGRVIFTSGATEAINLAIKGVALHGRSIAHSVIEHSAVLDTVAALGGGYGLPVGAMVWWRRMLPCRVIWACWR
jgi:cysteine desulfurase